MKKKGGMLFQVSPDQIKFNLTTTSDHEKSSLF